MHRWSPLSVDALRPLIAAAPERVWLSGGVALDLALGRTTRPHHDIDVSVVGAEWADFAGSLPGWVRLHAAEGGFLTEVQPDTASIPANTWCEDVRTGAMVLQVNAESGTDTNWIYRRDGRIARPWPLALSSVDGIPTVAPAVQLLWKSKSPEPKDEVDWTNHAGRLESGERAWLTAAIAAAHPRSPWAGRF